MTTVYLVGGHADVYATPEAAWAAVAASMRDAPDYVIEPADRDAVAFLLDAGRTEDAVRFFNRAIREEARGWHMDVGVAEVRGLPERDAAAAESPVESPPGPPDNHGAKLKAQKRRRQAVVRRGCRYRHYRDGPCRVMATAVRQSDLTVAVIYAYDDTPNRVWDHTLADFTAEVEWEGQVVRRFAPMTDSLDP